MKNKLIILCLIGAMVTTLIMTGCFNEKTVKIGFVGSLSGNMAELGISGRNAFNLAIQEINNTGGINGMKIESVIMDDKSNPEGASELVDELVAQDVKFVIGFLQAT